MGVEPHGGAPACYRSTEPVGAHGASDRTSAIRKENKMNVIIKSTNKARRSATVETPVNPAPSPQAIAAAAYYRAERRGFAPGGELSDWLEAERELDQAPLQS